MFPKKPSDSEIIKTEVVCPNDTNPMGVLKGGRLVEWMDIAAAVCAQTHSGKICVTASIHQVDFHESAHVGDIITISARITRAFTTSMEIYVFAFGRAVPGGENYLISEAWFTLVALTADGNAAVVLPILPETEMDRAQYAAALTRKRNALANKRKKTAGHDV